MKITPLPIPADLPANQTNVSIAVLGKNLDTIEKAGQNLIKMMERSVQPHLGKNIDFRI